MNEKNHLYCLQKCIYWKFQLGQPKIFFGSLVLFLEKKTENIVFWGNLYWKKERNIVFWGNLYWKNKEILEWQYYWESAPRFLLGLLLYILYLTDWTSYKENLTIRNKKWRVFHGLDGKKVINVEQRISNVHLLIVDEKVLLLDFLFSFLPEIEFVC